MTDALMIRDVDAQLQNICDTFDRVDDGKNRGVGPWSTLYKESFLWENSEFTLHIGGLMCIKEHRFFLIRYILLFKQLNQP